jgi:hypothetical protein
MNDVIVSVLVFLIMGLAYGIIPGGDKLVWVWRPPRNKYAAAFIFGGCILLFVKGILELAH